MAGGKRWSEAEDRIIWERFPVDGPFVLAAVLNRSPHSIRCRAKKLCVKRDPALVAKQRRRWNNEAMEHA